MRVMELLNLVINRADIPALEEKVKLDAALSYRLLNYINSPANGMQQPIQSIGHAITLIGYDQLYRWLTLLMFTSGTADERSRALLKNALVRGRFCESLGKDRLPSGDLGGLFIVGIFSLLDALLNIPMGDALTRLNLPKPVVDALSQHKGIYAPYLQLASACENFDQDTIARYSAECGLDADTVNVAHVNALIWAEQIEV
jgi:EAL and modified HD-GYP domain-containing signal transduction protein